MSRINLADFLTTSGNRNVAGAHTRVQSALIVAESALVVVLLAGAGLLIRSYINVESIDTGFSQSTVSMNISLDAQYKQPQRVEFFRSLFARIEALPGVQTVGGISNLPLRINSESCASSKATRHADAAVNGGSDFYDAVVSALKQAKSPEEYYNYFFALAQFGTQIAATHA